MSSDIKKENREISKKNVVLTIVFWALTLAWILVIFMLSNIPLTEANENLNALITSFRREIPSYTLDVATNPVINTIVHVFEFGLLTVFAYLAISSTNKISVKTSYAESPMKILKSDNEMNIIFTLWFTILNAIFDEYHQLFVEGHDGGVIDLCKDIIGIIFILLWIRVIFSISLKVRGKKEIRYT
ncbi:MAG: VanZ family protein [Saccharofermentans sp.]|nr:VanZ family protein [Saccharofermentans sp.]